VAKILIIDDDRSVPVALQAALRKAGNEVEITTDIDAGISRAEQGSFAVVVSDLQWEVPGTKRLKPRGLDLIERLRKSGRRVPIILMTAMPTSDTTIAAAKLGAYDYITKPKPTNEAELEEFLAMINAAARESATAAEKQPASETTPSDAIIGKSKAMQVVFKEIGRIAAKPVTVLLRGETGTGKELLARTLHKHSDRADKPFVIVNCVAIPELLLESELFGHEPGVFTGALGQRIGRFQQADGGTIFLDEIGDMTIETQAKLLRVLQEKTIQRLGGKGAIPVDVRVIAATHRDLHQAMQQRKFRDDLYHRLNEAVIHIPPLRERTEDIPALVKYFINRHATELRTKAPALEPEEEVLEILKRRTWPGNVRELKNLVHKAVLASRGYVISPEIIRKALEQTSLLRRPEAPPPAQAQAPSVPESTVAGKVAQLLLAVQRGETAEVQEQLHAWAEAEIYRQGLRIAGGDVDKAGAALGVSRSTVRARMSQYGLSSDGAVTNEVAPAEPSPAARTEAQTRILVVEDDESDAMAMKRFLTKAGYDSEWVGSMAAALTQTQKQEFDLVVTDLDLKVPGASGLELISQLRVLKPHLPAILLTGYHSPSRAIEATRLGAYDYLPKPVSWGDSEHLAELHEMVKKAVQSKRLMAAPPVSVGRPAYSNSTDAIIGQSRAMQEVYKEIGRVAVTPLTVLIRGETGTGKELVARAVYSHCDPERASQPFIEVNCAAIPPSLLESELFGHEKGAFTGAAIRRLGRFEQAHRGTIFLDEIGDMNVHLQQKLLRVLQEKTIVRVGGDESIPVDVRIIAATHRDLERAARDGSFRQDLYFRLNVAVISLPPLRERPEDIPELVYYFLEKCVAELSPGKPTLQAGQEGAIFELLQKQPWPGNIRELRNIVRRAVIMCRGFPISVDTIREVLEQTETAVSKPVEGFAEQVAHFLAKAQDGERQNIPAKLLEEVERELYSQAIEQAGGDQTKAAKWLGVSRPTVMSKLLKHDVHPTRGSEKSNGT
jgi:DNA-binding NtrC family response regulator